LPLASVAVRAGAASGPAASGVTFRDEDGFVAVGEAQGDGDGLTVVASRCVVAAVLTFVVECVVSVAFAVPVVLAVFAVSPVLLAALELPA
jgi:hypothetical protein